MSTTIDERVVEMRFDNRHFENNVSTTMSTLDKLKQKLNLTGATKGLDNINAAAKNNSLPGLGAAVETVQAKFSALGVIGVTALANITNSAVNAGKRMISALTIDPIMTGFSEYETKMNAIQTIWSNTQSKGTTMDDITRVIGELNTYADKTIYNFAEMTRNIGTFTAAGIGLEDSAMAIQGIANLAAMSGSNSQQASTAMYQLSQALASGTVKLMDWNSVVNAGMGGQLFQDALKDTARAHGVAVDEIIAKEGSFRESLTQGWITADILTETLSKMTKSGAAEYLSNLTGIELSQITSAQQLAAKAEDSSTAYEELAEQLASTGKISKEQAMSILEMADNAEDAATKVKTFTQLWDTMKESVQSGWAQTWELIIGDFDEAKEVLSKVSDTFGDIVGRISDARNTFLGGALNMSKPWSGILDKLSASGVGKIAEIAETVQNATKSLTDFQDVVSKIWDGDIGGGTDRISAVTEMGFDPRVIQELVNRGSQYKLTMEDVEAAHAKFGLTMEKTASSAEQATESTDAATVALANLTDEELRNAGLTDAEIKLYRELAAEAERSGRSIADVAKEMSEMDGRTMIINSIKNAWSGLVDIFKVVRDAWNDVFPSASIVKFYNTIKAVEEFSQKLRLSSETAEKLSRIFKGVFSVLDIGRKIVESVARAVWDLLNSDGMGSLVTFLLDVAAAIGDFFTSLNQGFDTGGISNFLSTLVTLISDLIEGTLGPIESFGDAIAAVGDFIVGVAKKIWDGVKPVFDWLRENISAGDIFAGLAGGGIFVAAKKISGFLDKIIDTFKNMLGGKDGGSSIKEQFGEVLGGVKDALNSFTSGIKISSIVSVAIAVGILSAALKTISEINVGDSIKAISAIGVMMGMLTLTLKSMTKTLDAFDSKGLIKAGASLILVATAVTILASAMEKIGKLPLKDIGKGLIGIGGGLAELAIALKIIDKTKISLKTSVAIIALAQACKMLGDAMQKFAKLSWDEIARGLSAMGGALAEFVAAIAILNKFGGFKSLFGSAAILIAVQSLEKMADGLKKFAEMSWDEIKRGLTAMGGALGELGIVLSGIGKIAGFSSIFAAGAIWIVTQGLDDLAAALKKFSEMTWEEIGRGLAAMGGALAEVGGITGAIGKLAGFSSIFASGAILLTIQGLDDLAAALKKFGEMTWEEIGRGLSAMGGALLEVGGFSGAIGMISGFSGLLGSGTILATIQGLDDLANSLKKFGEMTWDEIGRGLTAMGGALLEVGGISGGLGALTGLAGIFGGAAIWTTVQGLEDLANSLKKFGEMSWDEIGRGLSAMGGALGEVALGGFLSSLSILGGIAITEIAGSLGDLADGVKKWSDVTVPEDLGTQLADLAKGVEKFTFAGVGAGALSDSAAAVGILADSTKKWKDVTIPDGLAKKFDTLSSAVKKFWDSGLGAGALETIAKPFGDLADSVKKWSGVTVPENIGEDLTKIASGVKEFSFAFAGGWSISALVTPLGNLSDSIRKWIDVTVPANIGTDLTNIATGVKAFSFAFESGWSLDTIVTPLGDLAGAVSKWKDVTVSESIGTDLSNIASGVSAFSLVVGAGVSISSIIEPLSSLPDAIKKWDGISIPEGLGSSLASLASGIAPFSTIGDVSMAASSVGSLVTALQNLSGINISGIGSDLSGLASSLSDFSAVNEVSVSITQLSSVISTTFVEAASKMSEAGSNMITSLANGMLSKVGIITVTIDMTVVIALTSFMSKTPMFMDVGGSLIEALTNGISNRGVLASAAIRIVVLNAANTARGGYSGFYEAGAYCVQGFANGITAYTFMAQARAAAMAQAALQSAKAALGVASPSKEFYAIGDFSGQGFVNALYDYAPIAYRAGSEMADSAREGLNAAISKLNRTISSDINAQPVIRPVLDLTSVQNGVNAISGLFANRTLTLAHANTGFSNDPGRISDIVYQIQDMNDTHNGEVVQMLSDLRGDFGDLVNAIASLKLYLNGDTVVGELIGKIDKGLGKIATHKGRGN